MTSPKITLMAQFYNASFDRRGKGEVKSEQEAVQKAIDARAFFFETYEVTSLHFKGKTLVSEGEERSGRRFVGIDRLYTKDEVIAQYEKDLADAKKLKDDFDRRITATALRGVIREYKNKYGPDDRFIPEPGRGGDFIGLAKNEKAFDSKGTQLWPQPK